ncbi:RRP15-like protein [Chelonus insularis]|uniref:RRP15-like protein n=1 Tax=Chelonus insularis TaxID=460826 RepID=UPI00158BD655|nr:RRP15-like protein [Chelonus insularis]XP_034938997.1 RRP15-like protein [Chelonus insularis]
MSIKKKMKNQNDIDDDRLSDSQNEDGDAYDDEQSEMEQDDNMESEGNPGWADVFQKILNTNKPKKKKTLVLSKAKKLSDVAKKSEISTDADDAEQTAGVSKKKKVQNDGENKEVKSKLISLRKKPSVLDRPRERVLQKIATKGIVQLFNAVEKQQAQINKNLQNAGPLMRKQEKVLQNVDKRVFLDMLMGNTKSISVDDEVRAEQIEKSETDKDEKVWSVLRDDFVMGAKLKDWDKKANESELSSEGEDIDGP